MVFFSKTSQKSTKWNFRVWGRFNKLMFLSKKNMRAGYFQFLRKGKKKKVIRRILGCVGDLTNEIIIKQKNHEKRVFSFFS